MSLDIYLTHRCPTCGESLEVFSANITHNLGRMAQAAGIHKQLWYPDENGIKTAADLIGPLREGIAKMEKDPDEFKRYNAASGWGIYDNFLPWLKHLLAACEETPDAEVSVYK